MGESGLILLGLGALVAMAVMGRATHSVSGALLGLVAALVTLAVIALRGDLGLSALCAMPIFVVALGALAVFVLTVLNVSRTGARQTLPNGASMSVEQWLLGEGAKHAQSPHISMPLIFSDRDSKYLDDGR